MDENTKTKSNTLPNKDQREKHPDTETGQQNDIQTENNTKQHDTQGTGKMTKTKQHTNTQIDTHTETYLANNQQQDPTPNNTPQPDRHTDTEAGQKTNTQIENNTAQHDTQETAEVTQTKQHTKLLIRTDPEHSQRKF